MPNRILLIFITLLLGIGSASAQKYPERSLVRKGNRDFAKERYDRSIERYTQAQEAAFLAAGHTRDEADAWHDFCYALTKAAVDAQNITLAAPYTWTLTRDNYNTAGTRPELTPRLSTTSATPNSNRKNTRKRSKATRTPCG